MEAVELEVRVVDEAGAPVGTAAIRHPQEKERHAVNRVDGSWRAEVLYLPDGQELWFHPGDLVKLEVSAPGYANAAVEYTLRKRRNLVVVELRHGDDFGVVEDPENVTIPFGRDVPLDK